MKKYRIIVVYRTQHAVESRVVNVHAENAQMAKWLAQGIVWEKERDCENRYIRFLDSTDIAGQPIQDEIEYQML